MAAAENFAFINEEEKVTRHKVAEDARKMLLVLISPKTKSSWPPMDDAQKVTMIFIKTVVSSSKKMALRRMRKFSAKKTFQKYSISFQISLWWW